MTYDEMVKHLAKMLSKRMRIQDDQLFSTMYSATLHQREMEARAFQQTNEPNTIGGFRRSMNEWRYGFSGFRDGQGRMAFPDDGKTITLSKDDCKVVK